VSSNLGFDEKNLFTSPFFVLAYIYLTLITYLWLVNSLFCFSFGVWACMRKQPVLLCFIFYIITVSKWNLLMSDGAEKLKDSLRQVAFLVLEIYLLLVEIIWCYAVGNPFQNFFSS